MTRRTRHPASTLILGLFLVLVISALAGSLVLLRPRWQIHAAEPAAPSAAAPQPPRFDSIQLSSPTVIDMKRAGVRGDGLADDSARIQAIIEQAPNNTRFYFPAGTYRIASVVIANRSGLELYGDGGASILQWSGAGLPRSETPMMTFSGVSDLLIRDLAFDNRSIPAFGGVVFYSTKRVEIKNTSFTDSRPRPSSHKDRYGFVFAHGSSPHQDLKIHDNVITNLQLEVDHAERVEIRNNTVTRGTQTAGIGLFTVNSGALMHDYLIDGNLVIDPEPPASGIAVHLDPPTDNRSSFRRIRIANNSIVFKTAGTMGISIGTPYVPAKTLGNVFEDVAIEGNLIRVHSSAPGSGELVRVLSNGSFVFSRLVVRGNVLLAHGRLAPTVDSTAQIRYAQEAVIASNSLRRAVNGLIVVAPERTQITDNAIEAVSGPAYSYSWSRGGNVVRSNYFFGTVSNPVAYQKAPQSTDVMQTPTMRAAAKAGPAIGQLAVSNLTSTTATITWHTDQPATSEAEYSTDLSYVRTTYPRLPFVRQHQLSLVDLRPNTSYNVRVRSIDTAGTEAISQNHTFRTRESHPPPEVNR
jgi:Pectate lyase superfamily protein/Fibronectin type III domain